ncbi:MAG: hypothetical protein ACKV2T_22045 [Kofleriaceae bacterium]
MTLALTSSALAQPSLVQPLPQPVSPAPAPHDEEDAGYRNQILIASGLGMAAFLGAAAAEGPNGEDTPAFSALFAVGGITTFLAPPIIHFAHGELGRGGGSFGVRYGLAAIGALVGMSARSCNEDEDFLCKMDGIGPGAFVGVAIASVIDAFVITKQPESREATRRPVRVFQPVVTATQSGGQVGLVGTF